MDNRCIFCGAALGVLNQKKLHCGSTVQVLCKVCYPQYKKLSAIERAEAAWHTGRADHAEDLQNYLYNIHRSKQAKEAERAKDRAQKATDMKCLRCDGQMMNEGPVTFKLGEEKYLFSDWNRLISGAVTLHVYRCEKCGKVEFFSFDENALANHSGD